ncbi:MAG: diaminobutyrate--2-oxoglutarate transaminase [Planctomycetota bacterium]
MEIFNERESEVRGYCRDYPVIFETAKGARLTDEDGTEYIDFLGGAGTLNYGHNPEPLKQAVLEHLQNDRLLHGLDMHTATKRRFLEVFSETILAPRGLDYKLQFTGPTGTNAVEAALKLARKVTGRHEIFAFTNGFHGVTQGALACTGNRHHREGSGILLSGVTRVPYQGYMDPDGDTIGYIRRLLEDPSSGVELPAAMIVETIQGEGGVNVASYEWLRKLQELCKEFGSLLIVDDIQVGCGRTGTFFSFEGQEIEPDIVTLSKSLSGIGLPMALVLMKPELDEWNPGEHNGTFRGNNLAFASATAAIEHYWSDGSFTAAVRARSRMLRERFCAIRDAHPEHGIKVRGRGMIYGLEMPVEGMAAKVVEESFARKLIIENCGPNGAVIKFLAPLTIDFDDLEAGLDRLTEAVAAAAEASPILDAQDAASQTDEAGQEQESAE